MGLASAAGEAAQLAVRISLDDKLSGGLTKISRNLGKFEASNKRVGKGLGQVAGSLAKVGVIAAGAAATGIGVAVKWAGDFEAQLNTINTIAQTTPDKLTAIGDGIRQIARDTGIATDELTSSYYDLLSAGVKTADAQAVLNDAVTLGIGALGSTTETVDLLTTAYNAYGLDAKGAAIATDQFAQAVKDGKVTASEIAATFANVASVAKTAGIGIDQIAAAYADLTAQGVPAAEVTTEMNRAIVELIKPNKALLGLQEKLGKSYADIARKKGLVPALEEMRKDAKKTGVSFQDLFGRLEGYKFALQTTGPEFKKFMAEQALIIGSTGQAAKQAAERQQGFNYSLSVLTANVKDAGITIGSFLLPPLGKLAQKASAFLRRDDIQKKLKDLGSSLAKAIDGIDFDKLLGAAEGFGRALEPALKTLLTIGQLISKLPPELLGAGAGLIITNKITGGALGSGLGNIFGGLGESLAKSLASKIPVFGNAFVQPVFVTNKGFGDGGGAPGVPGGGGFKDLLGGGLAAAVAVAVGGAMNAVSATLTTSLSAAFGASGTPLANTLDAVGQQLSPLQGIATTLTTLDTIPGKLALIPGELGRIGDVLNGRNTTVTPGLTGGAPGRGGATPQGSLTGGAPGRGTTNAVNSLHHAAVPAINAVRGSTDKLAAVGHGTTAATERVHHASIANLSAARAIAADTRHAGSVTAGKLTSVSGKLSGANAKLDAIRHKRTKFSVHTNVSVNTRVSVSELQRQARYSSRVARSTSLSAS